VSQAGRNASNAAGNAVDTAARATSDTAITSAVKSKLLANSSTPGMNIHVETDHGVVTLHGTVESDAEKATAERIAHNTKGVKDVTNNLKVSGG
jgi:osmotically-inducible protein OsmY